MKMEEIRDLGDGDLRLQETHLRKELFKLRCQAATESIDNPNRIGEIKRSIARLLTEQNQRTCARSQSND